MISRAVGVAAAREPKDSPPVILSPRRSLARGKSRAVEEIAFPA
jgi:hypothetical protein